MPVDPNDNTMQASTDPDDVQAASVADSPGSVPSDENPS